MAHKLGKKQTGVQKWLLLIVGACLILYPLVSQVWYYVATHQQINQFSQAVEQLSSIELTQRLDLARAYNEALQPSKLQDPYTELQKEARADYARMIQLQEKIGYVSVPKIDVQIPIFAGSSESVLQKGAGHLEGTSLPIGGAGTHTVITAHSGLPTARLFTDLHFLKEGDIFYITSIAGKNAYRVDQIQVVEPTDLEKVAIDEEKDYATLLTCTPYMVNSHRLLVRGERIADEENTHELERVSSIPVAGILSALLLIIIGVLGFVAVRFFRE